MKKVKVKKIIGERLNLFLNICENQEATYGFQPKWKAITPLFEHTQKLYDEIPSKSKSVLEYKLGPKGDHYIRFLDNLTLYTQKMLNNGKYYSELLLRSLRGPFTSQRTLLGLIKSFKYIDLRIDTLLAFTVTRSRLEEMTLNLYFLHKSEKLIKEKKWSDLYKLIFKINYSGYQDNESDFKYKKNSRLQKKELQFILKNEAKLHISEIMKYVVKQKDLYDDFDPLEVKIEKKNISRHTRYSIHKFLAQNKNLNDKGNYYSMKPIKKFYDLLSNELHPNNLFLRNVITTRKEGVELTLITRDHLKILKECDDFICETNEVLYDQTIKIIHFFLNKTKGSKKDQELLRGFNQSVDNKIMSKL
tara:strand:- start:111 stop:1193 length:1083 start_codon:yes stop_codon:yes gene_type:complete